LFARIKANRLTRPPASRGVFQETLFYGGSAFFSKSAAAFAALFLAWKLSSAGFGILDFVLISANLFCVVCTFGQDSAFLRCFHEEITKKNEPNKIPAKFLFRILLQALVLSGLVLLIGSAFPSALGPVRTYFPWFFLLSFTGCLTNFCLNVMKMEFDQLGFFVTSMLYASLHLLLVATYCFVAPVEVGQVLQIYGLSSLVFSVLCLVRIRGHLHWPGDLSWSPRVQGFALSMGSFSILQAASPFLERMLLLRTDGSATLGCFALAQRFAFILLFLGSAFQTAWIPYYLSRHRHQKRDADFDFIFRVIVLLTGLAVLAVLLPGHLIITKLYASSYPMAAQVLLPLCLAAGLQTIGSMTEIGSVLAWKGKNFVYGWLWGWLPVVLAATTLPGLGLEGLCYLFLANQIIRCGFLAWKGSKHIGVPWPLQDACLYLGLIWISGFVWQEVFTNPRESWRPALGCALLVPLSFSGVRLWIKNGKKKSF